MAIAVALAVVVVAWLACGGIYVHSSLRFVPTTTDVPLQFDGSMQISFEDSIAVDSRRMFGVSRFYTGAPFHLRLGGFVPLDATATQFRVESLRLEFPDGGSEVIVGDPAHVGFKESTWPRFVSGKIVHEVLGRSAALRVECKDLDPDRYEWVRVKGRISILANNEVVETVVLNKHFILEEAFRIYPYFYDLLRRRA